MEILKECPIDSPFPNPYHTPIFEEYFDFDKLSRSQWTLYGGPTHNSIPFQPTKRSRVDIPEDPRRVCRRRLFPTISTPKPLSVTHPIESTPEHYRSSSFNSLIDVDEIECRRRLEFYQEYTNYNSPS
jgi:hypothetical protein